MKRGVFARSAWTRALVFGGCAVAVGLTACGDGSAESSGPSVATVVTRDFGRTTLSDEQQVGFERRDTLLRQLRREHDVRMRKALGEIVPFVEAIDGLKQNLPLTVDAGTAWVTYVNGIETDPEPAKYGLHPGDVVQWDLRRWHTPLDVRATIGAFPETFTGGMYGRLFPVRLQCERPASVSCAIVRRALRRAGVPIGSRPRSKEKRSWDQVGRATIAVGTWREVRGATYAKLLDQGTRSSGIFARFSEDGDALHLLDWEGDRARTLGAGTGLVGATRPTEGDLRWYVTGVDDAGVERAARSLVSRGLRHAYAVAVTRHGVTRLPLPPG